MAGAGVKAGAAALVQEGHPLLAAPPIRKFKPGDQVGFFEPAETTIEPEPWTARVHGPGLLVDLPPFMKRDYSLDEPDITGSREIVLRSWTMEPGDWERALAAVHEMYEAFARRVGSTLFPGLYETEADVMKKFVLEDGYAPHWYVLEGGGMNDEARGRVPLPTMEATVSRIASWVDEEPDPTLSDMAAVVGKQDGIPTRRKGLVSFMVHDALALVLKDAGAQETRERIMDVQREIGEWDRIYVEQGSRTGWASSPATKWELVNGEVTATGEYLQLYPRRRAIWMVSKTVTQKGRRTAVREKKAIKRRRQYNHTTDKAIMEHITSLITDAVAAWNARGVRCTANDFVAFEGDFSAYDRTVGYPDQKIIAKGLRGRTSRSFEEVYLDLQEWPVLMGPMNSARTAFVQGRRGMTVSGAITTTNDGIVIGTSAVSTIWAVLREIGPEAAEAEVAAGLCPFVDWGDDILVWIPVWLVHRADLVKPFFAALGYKLKLQRGAFFLFRYRDAKSKKTIGSLARAVGRCFNKEHIAPSLVVEILGDYERLRLCVDHPLFELGCTLVFSTKAWYRRHGIKTWNDLLRIVTSDWFRIAVNRAQGVELEGIAAILERYLIHADSVGELLDAVPWLSGALATKLMLLGKRIPDNLSFTQAQAEAALRDAITEYKRTYDTRARIEMMERHNDNLVIDDRLIADPTYNWSRFGFSLAR